MVSKPSKATATREVLRGKQKALLARKTASHIAELEWLFENALEYVEAQKDPVERWAAAAAINETINRLSSEMYKVRHFIVWELRENGTPVSPTTVTCAEEFGIVDILGLQRARVQQLLAMKKTAKQRTVAEIRAVALAEFGITPTEKKTRTAKKPASRRKPKLGD